MQNLFLLWCYRIYKVRGQVFKMKSKIITVLKQASSFFKPKKKKASLDWYEHRYIYSITTISDDLVCNMTQVAYLLRQVDIPLLKDKDPYAKIPAHFLDALNKANQQFIDSAASYKTQIELVQHFLKTGEDLLGYSAHQRNTVKFLGISEEESHLYRSRKEASKET